MISYNSSSLCAVRRRRQIALSASRLATRRAYAGEFLSGRPAPAARTAGRQVDCRSRRRRWGFQLDKNADSTQRILFQFSVGNGDTIADPGTAHFSRVRIASNTTCGGKLNCLAASSLMISRARFLLWQCTATGTFWFRTLLSCREPNRCSS